MNYERIEAGTAFRLEYAGDGIRVESVRAEAVDGFGGDHHEFARRNSLARQLEAFVARIQ